MDRFYRGLVAGTVAGIPMNIWSNVTREFGFGELRFLDWAGMVIYGSLPVTLFQQAYAQIIQFFWLGFLGVIFSFLIPKVTSRGDIGKAVFFGVIMGFILYAIPVLFKVPNLTATDSVTVLNNHLGGVHVVTFYAY